MASTEAEEDLNSTPSPPFQLRGSTFRERLASAASLLADKKNILVLVGAGASVSCGIPDFRSEGTGLYHTLNCQELGLTCPEDLFDIEAFGEDPRPFYRFAKTLRNPTGSSAVRPGPSHEFLAFLDGDGGRARKRLLRVYTQNIDGLERRAGVDPDRIVYAHGSLAADASCTTCRASYRAERIESDIRAGTVPLCRKERKRGPTKKRGKRTREDAATDGGHADGGGGAGNGCAAGSAVASRPMRLRRPSSKCGQASEWSPHSSLNEKKNCGGVIKPGIVFFGEKLDDRISLCLERDKNKADAIIVLGTSLSVAPMSKVVEYLKPSIPRLLFNRNIISAPKSSNNGRNRASDPYRDRYLFDACLLGDCDEIVQAVVRELSSTNDCKDDQHITASKEEGKILSSPGGERTDRWLKNQPPESVLLFKGALMPTADENSEGPPIKPLQELVHCDGCQREISGDVFCCQKCFDYDLCSDCYPALSTKHADGKHEFALEEQL